MSQLGHNFNILNRKLFQELKAGRQTSVLRVLNTEYPQYHDPKLLLEISKSGFIFNELLSGMFHPYLMCIKI